MGIRDSWSRGGFMDEPGSQKRIRDYKDLHVWQKGMELAKQAYLLTSRFPSEEKFGLVSQIRRAVVSIPSNIAEGQARNTTGEFVQFISYAEGSAAEVDTQLRLSIELGYCAANDLEVVSRLLTDVQKMLKRLRHSLTTNP
jgi:four helix bundle protein